MGGYDGEVQTLLVMKNDGLLIEFLEAIFADFPSLMMPDGNLPDEVSILTYSTIVCLINGDTNDILKKGAVVSASTAR